MKQSWSIKGSFPPLITPFADGKVDYKTYARLVEYQIKNGSHGILVNGTTAEPSTLTVHERNKLVETAIKSASGSKPIVAATGSQSFAETERLTQHAIEAGADALLIVTPYYIRPSQQGMIDYFLKLAELHELPWMIYHIPGRAAVNVSLDTLTQLKKSSKNFVGMKHAANDLGFVSDCLQALGTTFRIFVGLEELSFPMMAVGACGLMNAVGNLKPKELVEMVESVWNNDFASAKALHFDLLEINRSVFYDTNPIPIKYMMRKIGLIPSNEHRLPMIPASPKLARRLDDVLRRADLIEEALS